MPFRLCFFLCDVLHQATVADKLLHERWNGLYTKRTSVAVYNPDASIITVHFDFLAIRDRIPQIPRFKNGQSDVEGIPVKYAGKTLGDDTGNPGSFDGDRRVFSR